MSEERLRADKWLWYARLVRSRTLAAALCASGRLRRNGAIVTKASVLVQPGDVLVLPLEWGVRVVRVRALGSRRGPAREACQLYEELGPQPPVQLTACRSDARAG